MSLHVIKSIKNKWILRKSKSKRALKLFSTRNEAINYALNLAINNSNILIVHYENGAVDFKFKENKNRLEHRED